MGFWEIFLHSGRIKSAKHLVLIEKTTTFAPHLRQCPISNKQGKADMAQLVEQFIRNEYVPGSSPGIGSNAVIAQLVEH